MGGGHCADRDRACALDSRHPRPGSARRAHWRLRPLAGEPLAPEEVRLARPPVSEALPSRRIPSRARPACPPCCRARETIPMTMVQGRRACQERAGGTWCRPGAWERVDASIALLRVLELGQCLEGVLARARQHDPARAGLEQLDGDRYVVLAEADEAAGADDGIGERSVGCDDQIVDDADLLVLVVVHVLSKDLLLGAPANCDHFHFLHADREEA